MGCTSSATNMPPSIAYSEKDLELSEVTADIEEAIKEGKEVILKKENESNGMNVLPTCDTLGDTKQLDRNTSSKSQVENDGYSETDKQITTVTGSNANSKESYDKESENESATDLSTPDINETTSIEEKLSTLEEVVEKVVELYIENGIENTETNPVSINKNAIQPSREENKENETLEIEKPKEEAEEVEAEEAVSPSQSQSSRATRWEALADIAAELPPSLAVDPVTGQIYALK